MELEFALQCVVMSTSKIFTIGADLAEQEITQIVRDAFNEGVRMSLQMVLNWASKTHIVCEFFKVFKMFGPEPIKVEVTEEEMLTYEQYQKQAYEVTQTTKDKKFKPQIQEDSAVQRVSRSAAELINNRRSINFRTWLSTAMQPMIAYRLESRTVNNYTKVSDELKVKLEWVYGIRSNDTRKALQYTVGVFAADSIGAKDDFQKQTKQNNEEIIFYIASVVVLLNPIVVRQRFYLSHDQEVISIAVSTTDGSIIASGELGQQPVIHVWSRISLESISIIKGQHIKGVHLLQFTNDSKYLATCGLTNPSAIVVYDWAKGEVVISASISSLTQEIFLLQEISTLKGIDEEEEEVVDEVKLHAKSRLAESGIVVISVKEMVIFTLTQDQFVQSSLSLEIKTEDGKIIAEPICGIAIIADFKNQYFKNLNSKLAGQRHLFLTGHKDGKVLLWRSDSFIGTLYDYQDEITCMTKCYEGVAICTWHGQIHLWDIHLTKSTKTIDLQSLPFKILSYNISSCDYNQKRLLILTMGGDVIEIGLNESGGINSNRIKAKKINEITRITGAQKAMTILHQIQQTVLIGGDDGLISSYDLQTHELVDVWGVGAKITAIATLSLEQGGFIIAAGTATGQIILRQEWEETIPKYHSCGTRSINDLQFSGNGVLLVAVSSDSHIYLFQKSDGDYCKLSACKLDSGFAISANFSEDSKKIVVCTNTRKLLLFDPATYTIQNRVEDIAQVLWSNWTGRYPLITKSQTSKSGAIPICLGNQSNMVAAGDENGNVYLWSNVEAVRENIGVNLKGHSSSLQRISLTHDDKIMLTLGGSDQCLFQWKLQSIEQKVKIEERKDDNSQKQKITFLQDESLINELNYCYTPSLNEPEIGDVTPSPQNRVVVDNGLLIRGCNNTVINRVGAKLNFDPTAEEEWKRPPNVMLMLEHIYGIQASDRRNTIVYLHYHGETGQKNNNKSMNQSAMIQTTTDMSKLKLNLGATKPSLGMSFQREAVEKPIQYDQVHQTCNKNFAYYTSRFAIVYSPFHKVQKFYQGHSMRISCMIKHPTRRLIATGEVGLQPAIHIWDSQTLEPIVLLDTSHQGGVHLLAFSSDGKKLASLGMDRSFSIQIFQWEQRRTIAFRNLSQHPIFELKFFPFENSKIITCGYEHMAIWRLNGAHLSCKTLIKYESLKTNPDIKDERVKSVLMCVDFLNYRVGNSLSSDLIFGTSQGEITTYTSGKHFLMNQNAHKGAINCLKVSDKINDQLSVITGGEDGLIKIWNTNIQLLQVIDVKMSVPDMIKDLKNPRCYGIQSIEMYCCEKQQPRRLLVGLRCGNVVEAIITDTEDRIQSQMIAKRQLAQSKSQGAVPAMLDFSFFTFLSMHSSLNLSHNQKKIQCVVNPDHPVLISAGDDETLRIWNLEAHSLYYSTYLGTQATALAYSPDGAYLAVGLINGVVLILDAKLERKQFEGQELQEFSKPTLDVFMSPKESKASVVCLKYSFNGDYLAVSYNNEHREGTDNQKNQTEGAKNTEIGQREPSFILIYVNRISPKNPGLKLGTRDTYIKLIKINLPLGDFGSAASIRLELAVTHMDFSDCDNYLEMCVQKVNHECVIDHKTYSALEDIFVIWDIRNNRMVSNFESIANTKWPEWGMAAAINARFQGREINQEDTLKERELLFSELCHMSRVSRFSLLDAATCGSHQGNLYLFRFSALTIEKQIVADFRFDFVKKRDMASARSFCGHTSMINCIENFQDKIMMTTAIQDQCIIQWKVEYEDKHWELDFNQFLTTEPDPFAEVMDHEKFEKIQSEVWSRRVQTAEIQQGVKKEQPMNEACQLELQHVIGRRAFDRRMNLYLDFNDRITYQAGALQIFLNENHDAAPVQPQGKGLRSAQLQQPNIKQIFLKPDGLQYKSVSPELSCFCMSNDLRVLFCGTAETIANVYIWDTTTFMKLGEFSVANVPVITHIKVSADNKSVLLLGLTKEYYQMITMVDWTSGNRILFTRQFLNTLPYRIRDIEFFPNSSRNFITSGIQHLCFWRLSGTNLEYQVGELTIKKIITNVGQGVYTHNPTNNSKFGLCLVTSVYQQQLFLRPKKGNENIDDDYENLFVTFMNVIFIGDTLITSGDDGYLYLWARERLEHRTYAHETSIYALHANSSQGLFVSGGLEGIVCLWRLNIDFKSSVKTLERVKTFNLRPKNMDTQTAVITPECNVQSVCLGQLRIIVGMRSGTIYEVPLIEESRTGLIRPSTEVSEPQVKRLMKCSDNEILKSIGIDMVSARIFTITQFGLFQVWDLVTFDVIFTKNYQKATKQLQSFKLSNKVMIVFDQEIKVLDSDPKTNFFDEKADYNLQLNQVTFATLNQNEAILGIAMISQALLPEITLYSTDNGFIKLKQIFGFKTLIKYLDFSTDNQYMQVEDIVGEVTLYEIETDRPIQTDAIDFEIEWLGEGLRTYPRLKGVRHQFTQSNKIVQMNKLLGLPIVVITDELGTIRVFNYPNVSGEPYYKCYTQHLFQIAQCLFSPDRLYFISCSQMDRCIFKWKVKFNEEKILQLRQEDLRKLNEISAENKMSHKMQSAPLQH